MISSTVNPLSTPTFLHCCCRLKRPCDIMCNPYTAVHHWEPQCPCVLHRRLARKRSFKIVTLLPLAVGLDMVSLSSRTRLSSRAQGSLTVLCIPEGIEKGTLRGSLMMAGCKSELCSYMYFHGVHTCHLLGSRWFGEGLLPQAHTPIKPLEDYKMCRTCRLQHKYERFKNQSS